MASITRDVDELEKAFLKWLEADLGGLQA